MANGLPSETNMLVDACIKRVRAAAHLDEDPVLPPLPVMTGRREVVVLAKSDIPIPSASEIVAAAGPKNEDAKKGGAANVETFRVVRRSVKWPVYICAFISATAASFSFFASPLGQRPDVRRVTTIVRVEANAAAHRAVDLVRGLHEQQGQ
jgi:hypothetical protein